MSCNQRTTLFQAGLTDKQQIVGGKRNARELWATLRTRLFAMGRMQRQWGNLHDIYDPVCASRFEAEEIALPRCIRDPDSGFTAFWDMSQVFLLLYVAIIVPFRSGFEVEVIAGSVAFFIDLTVRALS